MTAAPEPPLRAVLPLRALPSLTALQAFERTAARRSFRLAAQDLALSPSAISHQIRKLETHFGIPLFARDGQGVRLTQAGADYLPSVTRALSLLDEASRGMMQATRDARREIRVSALPLFMSTVLLPSVNDFERRRSNLRLRLLGTHDYADFEAGNVDVAIRLGREQTAGLRADRLLDVRDLPVCAPGLPVAGATDARALSGQVLIHDTRRPRAWADWFREMGVDDPQPADELWFDSLPAALDAADLGLGVALASDPLIRRRRGFGQSLVPAGAPSPTPQTVHLVYRPLDADARWMTAFRDWILDALSGTVAT